MHDSDLTDAGLLGKAFSSKGWIFELKIDGARCIAYISNGTVDLKNRRMRSITYRYLEIIRALKPAAGDVYLTEKWLYSPMVCQVFPL
jgi:hypothetical protein